MSGYGEWFLVGFVTPKPEVHKVLKKMVPDDFRTEHLLCYGPDRDDPKSMVISFLELADEQIAALKRVRDDLNALGMVPHRPTVPEEHVFAMRFDPDAKPGEEGENVEDP